ncbi:hypothetical protein K466DRAFT_98282 [Polyporus arcularius HHB13444]|uniref:Uncharacterized protein n=1 Tax=Polyporus arcularius HHB13444 TaxID=1314778 RepID=A0A5C3PDY5_9APHY|nr:hypothetical protein K466DRAFT_98282 [Polyporus arcularius HHB13444]
MPPSPSCRLSTSPYLPGAWPSPMRDHDDGQDADVSSLSSHGSLSAARRDSKARRRWTYTGPRRVHGYSSTPSLRCSDSAGGSASNEIKMSPLTQHTVSTALSSPLNTPDLADWPTQLGGSDSLLLDNFVSPASSPHPAARYSKTSPSRHGAGPSTYRPRFSSACSRTHHFPSPHLDPPLLNFIPGLPPLKLPLPDISVEFPYQESPSPTAPRRPHEHHSISPAPSGRRGPGYPSPRFPISSQSSMMSTPDADSPVLPPSNGLQPFGDESDMEGSLRTHLHPPEMDAFALATAVAASQSRSSFAIPPSVQSSGALASVGTTYMVPDIPRSPTYRRPSATTEESAAHRGLMALDLREEAHGKGSGSCLLPEHPEPARSRRVSAPQPSIWRSSRTQPVRTISSRVDVGQDGRKNRSLRQPVFGKVRKIGERLRGLFKNKVEPVPRGSPGVASDSLEYGLMTTTTAITNVEYESEHPIPLASPRARIMRNHRRSLPLPLLLASAEQLQSTISSRSPDGTDSVSESPPTVTVQQAAEPEDEQQILRARDLEDPGRSPRTPKTGRERTLAALQTVEAEQKPIKSRRFSLSSTLTKAKMDALRSTVIPRPPLPIPSSQSKLSVATDLARHSSAPRSDPSGIRNWSTMSGEDPADDRLWGGELPVLPDAHDGPVIRVVSDDSPVRTRTHTAPSPSALPQQQSGDTPTPKHKRSRRFSLSSMMAKRSSRAVPLPSGQPPLPGAPSRPRRPRGDTVTTITHGSVQFDMVYPRTRLSIGPWPAVPETLPSHRASLVSQSSGADSMYYDAREIASEDDDPRFAPERSSSPRPDSDLDSMSFARMADCSSGTYSIGSSTERECFFEASTSDPSTSGSHTYRVHASQRYAGPNAVRQLVAGSSSTPITKTLRFSPSLSLSFDMSCSDYEDDDDLGRLEQEEELSFMRTLGFEFDEIARRAREESL